MTNTWVYFIRRGNDGGIKIGHAADPHGRLRNMQTANEHELVLLGAIRGGREAEQELHKRFATARIRGEWFRATTELLAFIEGVTRLQEQPVDAGEESDWPFTEEQAEWMRGYIGAELERRWRESASGMHTENLQHLPVSSWRVHAARAESLVNDIALECPTYEDESDPVNRGFRAGAAHFDGQAEESASDTAHRLLIQALACRNAPEAAPTQTMHMVWPLEPSTVDWLRGFLEVGESVTEIYNGAASKAPVEERNENWHRLDRKVAMAREVGFPHHVAGIECALQWYDVLRKRPARLRPQPDESVEPEEPVDVGAALNTIMLGIGGDKS